MIEINTLKTLENNPRQISGDALERLKASISRDPEYMIARPLIVGQDNVILGGNQRWRAIKGLGMKEIPDEWVRRVDWDEEKARRFVLVDNAPQGMAGGWDVDLLREHWLDVDLDDLGLGLELDVDLETENEGLTDEDDVPDEPAEPVSKTGDVWLLGEHRVMCGDSTIKADVEKLMEGKTAALLHADPPYGMGKENDGVANDNLYAKKLDAFQMQWWRAFRAALDDNASAYIWGNAEDLWRLWYVGGLKDSERLTLRNEIVWHQVTGVSWGKDGMAGLRMFAPMGERCLFFMLGEQGFNNNADNYWDGWDSVVNYLSAEKKKTGWDIAKFKRLAGHSETSGCHWFDKSQWMFPTKAVYESWQKAAQGDAFKREYDDLKREFYATRAYFDNTHDNMTDVWEFQRVTGEERHGHATPKPVAMMERVMKSSLPDGGLCIEPFGGSGSTIISAEKTGRVCYCMELKEKWVDVIITRWQNFTGRQAVHAETGKTFDEMTNA